MGTIIISNSWAWDLGCCSLASKQGFSVRMMGKMVATNCGQESTIRSRGGEAPKVIGIAPLFCVWGGVVHGNKCLKLEEQKLGYVFPVTMFYINIPHQIIVFKLIIVPP